jgi:signal transduction histidine kinase
MLEDEGQTVLEGLETLAGERLASLLRTDADLVSGSGPLEEDAYVGGQEALAGALLDVARGASGQFENGASPDALHAFETSYHLWAVLLVDPRGRAIGESRPIPPSSVARLREALRRPGEIAFDFSGPLSGGESLGYLAFRRAGRPGIVLLLDPSALQYWAGRLAIQEAVGVLGWSRSIAYLVVTDPAGEVLAQRGDVPQALTPPPLGSGPRLPPPRRLSLGNREILEVFAPLRLAGTASGAARVGLEAESGNRLLRQARARSFQTAGLMLAIGLLAVAALFVAQTRHHRRLQAVTERLQQAERLSALGKLAAGLAHEIRNPLNAIGLAAQRIQREHPGAEGQGLGPLTTVIRDEVRRLNRLIEDFLRLSPVRAPKLESVPLETVLQELLPLVEEEARARRISVETQLTAAGCRARVDADRLKQALLNLLRNALEAIPEESSARVVRVRLEPRGSREVTLTIEDTGVGIPPEDRARVFDPDFTTKEKGLGLGLPMAAEIVRAHGGQIQVHSAPGGGTAFELRFPCESLDA